MSDEVHIAGIVVHAAAVTLPGVRLRIARLSGAEVRAADPRGKLVVVLEEDSAAAIIARFDEIRSMPGVLSAALVYQHAESAESMDEEVSDEDVAT